MGRIILSDGIMSLTMRCAKLLVAAKERLGATGKAFARSSRGNVAMIFALSLVPVSIAAGAGLDLSRALIVRARLAEALDSAGLAVGATSGLTTDQMKSLAQQYFNANYTADHSFGIPATVTVTTGTDNISLSTSVQMPTTLMNIVGINTLQVGYTSKVVWGQTKLWVSLVLDNTGSMCEPDNCAGTNNKITALKSATHSLLATLQNASANPGDVKVALVPFSKDVNVGTSYVSATWIDWTDWNAAPSNGTPSTSIGPGSTCPYSTSSYGYRCTTGPSNGAGTTNTIPSSGTYKGYICPGEDGGNVSAGRTGHYYNGCYTSVPTKTNTETLIQSANVVTTYSCTSNSNGNGVCTGSTSSSNSNNTSTTSDNNVVTSGYTGDSTNTTTGSTTTTTSSRSTNCTTHSHTTTCTTTWTTTVATPTTTVTKTGTAPYTHTWVANDHSTWAGCIMDRTQDYDTQNTVPSGTSTNFPAENSAYCPPGTVTPLTYDWTTLSSQVDAMTANGNTNQTIGLAWGWQALTDGNPFSPGTLPQNTQQIIILLSDGLNTQNRWSTSQSSIDAREALACTNAKTAGTIIYTVYVDLNGATGSSTALYNCATDHTKYFDLTTTGSIITTFNNIAQQITQLRVAQ